MRVVGILDGEGYPNGELAKWVEIGNWIAVADGGIKHLLGLNIIPKFIIGDMDSHESRQTVESFLTIKNDDQDTSDCDKLLAHCKKLGASEVILCCGHGGRLDHQLDIMNSLARNDLQGPIIYPSEIIYLLKSGTHKFQSLASGTTISIFPIHRTAKITTQGLKWEVDETNWEQPQGRSLSNSVVANEFELHIESGTAILTIQRNPGEVPDWFN